MSDTGKQTPFLVRVLNTLLRALVGAYALSVMGFLVARWLFGGDLVLIDFFNSIGHLLLIPALLLLPLSLLLRHWLNVALLLPAVAAFAFFYGVFFLPPTSPAPQNTPRLSLLSYNLLANNRPLDGAFTIIREADADVVLLQEVSSSGAPQIRQAFAAEYPYMLLHPHPRYGTHGQGILSKLPVLEDRYYEDLRLGNQRTAVQWRGQSLVLYNVHPPHPGLGNGLFDPAVRSDVLDTILEQAAAETAPVIIAGDFNMSDLSRDYDRFSSHYADAHRVAGWGMGWTFPADALSPVPLLRLDYVFYSPGWQAVESVRWPTSAGSDHYPLYVTLADLRSGGQ
jgi:endonuclease/exonuclease/phosphatase (EEP) superfamily protein YafD